MNLIPQWPGKPPIEYPDSDGKRMAENTLQLSWITLLYSNLRWLLAGPEAFVAADLLWYPVEGEPGVNTAPDVLVVFGRPDGHRGSYRQWEENGVPITVAIEIYSPGNDAWELADKYAFYEEHGVEEYYVYDPQRNSLKAYLRRGEVFRAVRQVDGFVSPRLGIRFDLSAQELVVHGPDGQPFQPLETERQQRLAAEEQARVAAHRAEVAEHRASTAEEAAAQAQRLATRLAELGRKARRGQASAEELAELDRLEEQQRGTA